MAIKYAVETVFKARDKQSAAFKKMGRNADKFGERTARAFKKASKSARRFDSVTKSILKASAVQKGLQGVSAGVISVTNDFLGFDQAVTAASAKFKGLDLTTAAGIKTLESLRKTARLVGRDTEFNARQAGEGLDFLALAGFNAKQAMALLPGVTNLATVANTDLATATDIASDSLGAFGLMTKNTEQLTKNFTRVQDVMAKTTATSNTSLTDMFEAVKKGAPDFTAAGQSIETFSTLIGTMANAGIKGAEAGTKLRNMAVRLTGGSKEASAMIENLGIKVADGSGNFRDMLDIIDDIIKGTSKMGEVQRSAALKTIFGARQTGGLNVILKEGTDQLRSYRQMLIDSSGASEKMAKIMRSSLLNRLKSLGSAATEVGFQLFSAFDKQGAGAIDNLTKMVRKVDLTPLVNGIKFVTNAAGQVFDRFEQIGEQTGLFDTIRESLRQVKPFFNTVVDVVKTLWNFMNDSGIIALMAKQLGFFVKVGVTLGKVFTKMWSIVKPVVQGMAKVLKPILSLLGQLLDAFGAELDRIGEIIDPTAQQKAVKNLAAQKRFGEEARLLQEGKAIPISRLTSARATGIQTVQQRKFEATAGNLFRAQAVPVSTQKKVGTPTDVIKSGFKTAEKSLRNALVESAKGGNFEKNLKSFQEFLRPVLGSPSPPAPPQQLNAPPQQESGTNDINLDITGAPETATVKQKSTGRAKPVSVSGLGRRAALQAVR